MNGPTNYPLCWPEGWKRTPQGQRKIAQFKTDGRHISVATACDRVFEELDRLGVSFSTIIISTNVQPTLSNRPRSSQSEPSDPGVAVYWTTRQGDRCMAIDRYTTVAGNLGAIAATIEAMRAIERHGGAEILDRAFAGFAALPGVGHENWWDVLEVPQDADAESVRIAYRRASLACHPDTPGGSHEAMSRINRAYDEFKAERGIV